MFKIDTNRINARQKCPYMNQIEKWHKNSIINVLISKAASLESLQGNNGKRIEKTYGYIISDIREDNPAKSNADYNLIEKILFPCGAKDDNQKNDVKIVCEAKHSNCILITNDGDSKSQLNGILGNREKLKAVGVVVMRAEEAVDFIKKLIEENDDLARKFSEETKGLGKPSLIQMN